MATDSQDPTRASPPREESETSWELLERIGAVGAARHEDLGAFASGGMARVHAVEDLALGRRSAMKVMHPAPQPSTRATNGFIREARITGQLEHPNIVPVHELGVDANGRPYYTMRLVEGRTLEAVVDALPAGPIGVTQLQDLLGVVERVCDALAFAQSQGVVHCDVKPSNVMVGDFGRVYLMDWGIACERGAPIPSPLAHEVAAAAAEVGGLPAASHIMGSPAFMAPEQAAGHKPDERADVFGVGGLLYYIVSRQPPFRGLTATECQMLSVLGDVRPLSDRGDADWVPRGLRRIIERALQPEPEDRYPTITALRENLVRFIRGGGAFPEVTFEAGDRIVREGEEADAAYVVLTGRCRVFAGAGERERTLRELGAGGVFGETAILTASTRTASVTALERSTLMRISREDFESELDHMKPWMGAFARALARRFRKQIDRRR